MKASGPTRTRRSAETRPGLFLAGDGVRGIGMVSVIIVHLTGGSLVLTGLYRSYSYRAFGAIPAAAIYDLQFAMPMFFVLSGYLIGGPWIRAYVRNTPAPSLRRYVRHRVARVVPVFWVVSAVILAIYGTRGSSAFDLFTFFGFAQIYHQSGAQSLMGQAWSVDVEIGFYLLVPVLAYGLIRATRRFTSSLRRDLGPGGRVALIVGLLVVAAVASALLRAKELDTAWVDSPPATIFFFVPGLVVAALELQFAALLARTRPRFLSPALALGALAFAVEVAIESLSDPVVIFSARGELAQAAACGLALASLLTRQIVRGDSPRWVDNRVTRWLGERSYPCYLIQSATIVSAVETIGLVGGGPWVQLLVFAAFVFPTTFAAGAVAHALIERPALAWGRGRGRPAAKPPPVAAADAERARDQPVLAPVASAPTEAS